MRSRRRALHDDALSARGFHNGLEELKVLQSEMRRRAQMRLSRSPEVSYAPDYIALQCENEMCPGIDEDHCCTAAGTGEPGHINYPLGRQSGMCGTDLTVFGGTGCVQLDQPGELDPSCPDSTGSSGTKPGCCTDTGLCGSIDNTLGRGCYFRSGEVGEPCGQ